MVLEPSSVPPEVFQRFLAPFCRPRELARLLAASRGLRSLRRGCVVSLLRNLFKGRPGASDALQWLRRHHRGDGDGGNYGGSGEPVLDDVGLLDWLYCLRDAAATGAYRASLGEEHSVVVTPGGRALAAGSGRHGVLGASGNRNRFILTEVDLRWGRFPGRIPVAAVACGNRHTLLLTAVGTVHSCGLGEYGRLGHGNENSVSRPTLVESLAKVRITQVAAGQAHSVAVSWGGEAYTWGWGFRHILGHGDELNRLVPTRLASIPPFASTEAAAAATATRGDSDDEGAVTSECASGGAGLGSGAGGAARNEALVDDGDRVTCAAAGQYCTVLGTRRGRVLAAGVIQGRMYENHFIEYIKSEPFELGRLDGGVGCRWVQCTHTWDRPEAETVMAVDSAGRAHEVSGHAIAVVGPNSAAAAASGPKKRRIVSDGRRSSSVAFALMGGAPRPLPLEPPLSECSSVLISPSVEGTGASWAENGHRDWGAGHCFVAVSADGHLLASSETGENDHLGVLPATAERRLLRRRRGGGVVHASAWVDGFSARSHGLLLVDGGASVVTHGNGRTGHLGHGTSGFEPQPKMVTAAVILGRAAGGGEGGGSGIGARSASLQISTSAASAGAAAAGAAGSAGAIESNPGQDAAQIGGGSGDGRKGERERGSVGLLALVDAAADERDREDGSQERTGYDRTGCERIG